METPQHQLATKTLPVFAVISEATQSLIEHRQAILRVLLLPFVLIIAVSAFNYYVVHPKLRDPQLIYTGLLVIIYGFGAVSCHRVLLLGNDSVGPIGVTGSSRREWEFVARWVAIVFVMIVLTLVALNVLFLAKLFPEHLRQLKTGDGTYVEQLLSNIIFNAPGYLILSLLFARLSLSLPAAAIDAKVGFAESIKLTTGNTIRLALLVYWVPVMFKFCAGYIVYLLPDSVSICVDSLVIWLGLAVGVAILSNCFRRLTGFIS